MISSKAETIISDDKIRNCNFIVTVILFELEKRDLGAILSREELLEALEEWNLEFSKTEISISLSNVCHYIGSRALVPDAEVVVLVIVWCDNMMHLEG